MRGVARESTSFSALDNTRGGIKRSSCATCSNPLCGQGLEVAKYPSGTAHHKVAMCARPDGYIIKEKPKDVVLKVCRIDGAAHQIRRSLQVAF